jgi:preprotein translocase subunit SecF
MLKIIQNRRYWYLLSGFLAAVSIFCIIYFGLNLSVDFRGGTLMVLKFEASVNVDDIGQVLDDNQITSVALQPADNNRVIIKSAEINTQKRMAIIEGIKKIDPAVFEESFQNIGPTVSNDLTSRSIKAVIFASLAIIIYLAIAFRGVPRPANPWRFGLCAISALLHDLLIVVGMAAIVGHFFHWLEIDSLFITALLTILGFSVHDTIVVFDRLRENLKRNPGANFEALAEESIAQTLSRSINTSVTTIFVLLSLFLLGGSSIKGFVFTLLFGIIIGTYSSIFNATPLLVSWQKFSERRKNRGVSVK